MEAIDLNDLLKPQFGVKYDLKKAPRDEIYAAYFEAGNAVIIRVDPELYIYSEVCSNMVCRVEKSELSGVSAEVTTDTAYIIVFREVEPAYIRGGVIEDASTFHGYLQFADEHNLNVPYLCSIMDNIYWFINFREKQRDVWRANAILLTNIEQKYYKPKFERVDAPQPYPTGPTMMPKMVNLTEVPREEIMTKSELASILSLLYRNNASVFANKLLITLGSSLQYSDMILDNEHLLSMRSIVLPPSMIFYGLRALYLEELTFYNQKRGPGRFILDIKATCNLPQFAEYYGMESPYLSTVASGVTGRAKSLSIPANFRGVRKIATLEQFKERFEKYTFGALSQLKWVGEGYKVAFNGSGICACAIINPLEAAFDSFEDYLEEYYPSRKNTKRVINDTKPPDVMYEFDDSDDDSDDYRGKRRVKRVTDEEFGDNNNNVGNREEKPIKYENPSYGYSDIDLMVECNFEDFDRAANEIFKSISDSVKTPLELVRTETENKHKYVINGLMRTIDLFHVDNIESVIVKYHEGDVRAWYSVTENTTVLTVKMFPSFVTAAMCGINQDIRWTSNRKDLRDTVLKYFQRGFCTLLNNEDKNSLIDYINKGHDNGTTSWPKHEIPANDRGSVWRMNRFNKKNIFSGTGLSIIFNPSISRVGIHQSINSLPQRADLSRVISKRDILQKECDYKSGKKILQPSFCPSIGLYL